MAFQRTDRGSWWVQVKTLAWSIWGMAIGWPSRLKVITTHPRWSPSKVPPQARSGKAKSVLLNRLYTQHLRDKDSSEAEEKGPSLEELKFAQCTVSLSNNCKF